LALFLRELFCFQVFAIGEILMTLDEMKRQKADLLLDFQETEQKLEHLKLKAHSLGDRLIKFGVWMQTSPETQVFRHRDAHCGFHPVPTANEYVQALSPDQYFDVAQEIRETSERLEQLRQRKERLGLH
jgi:hypothetical protein